MWNQFVSHGGRYRLARSRAVLRLHKTAEIRITWSHLPPLSRGENVSFFNRKHACHLCVKHT